jgi:hypothetical protein
MSSSYAAPGATSPTIHKHISAATVNETLVADGPADFRGYIFTNQHDTAWAWVKLYNKATAPVAGTDTPVLTLGLPPGGSGHIELDGGPEGTGIRFGTGLGFAITADEADADATVIGAGDVVLNLLYA